MDWLRQVPIGQYVTGSKGWLRNLDPRMKIAWVLMFLLTPILAGPYWRLCLVSVLLLITFLSSLPLRIWGRSLFLLIALSLFVGLLSTFLPTGETAMAISIRSPSELPNLSVSSPSWEIVRFGPFSIDRRSAELGIKTSSLIFTVIQSVNLMLLSTPPEDLIWALRWFMAPLALLGLPIDRISFQLLLSLRFLPLVQEELQNLLRSIASRSVDLKKIGFKASIALFLSVGERLVANILLRAEQGADALISRGGKWLPPSEFRSNSFSKPRAIFLNIVSGATLILVLNLRRKYGIL